MSDGYLKMRITIMVVVAAAAATTTMMMNSVAKQISQQSYA